MTEQSKTDQNRTDFEQKLASLCPVSRLDRDRLMFAAGQAAVRPAAERPNPLRRWFWPATAVAMTAAAGVLGVCLIIGLQPRVVREVVYVKTPGRAAAADKLADADAPNMEWVEPPMDGHRRVANPWDTASALHASGLPRTNYFHARHVALVLGVDALPQRPIASGRPAETLGVRDVVSDTGDAGTLPRWPW